MKRSISFATTLVLLVILLPGLNPNCRAQNLPFFDGFEGQSTSWEVFEEIVNSCYASGIGTVSRSTEKMVCGTSSLRLAPNAVLSPQSNHLIAFKRLSSTAGRSGVWIYSIRCLLSAAAPLAETACEVSMQNTRPSLLGGNRTSTAAVQYLANKQDIQHYGWWNVWINGSWQPLVFQPITPGEFISISVEADFTANYYRRIILRGSNFQRTLTIPGLHIAEEAKGFSPAFVITAEAENAYSNCGAARPTTAVVHYDNAVVLPGDGDLDGDGRTTCADLAIVKSSYGKACSDPAFNPFSDYDNDGKTGLYDLAYVSQHLATGTVCK